MVFSELVLLKVVDIWSGGECVFYEEVEGLVEKVCFFMMFFEEFFEL